MVALYSYKEGPNKEVAKFNVAMLVGGDKSVLTSKSARSQSAYLLVVWTASVSSGLHDVELGSCSV